MFRVIRGATKEEAEYKARLQMDAWNARWAKNQADEAARNLRLMKKTLWEKQTDLDRRAKHEAFQLTKEAEAEILAVRSLLSHALSKSQCLDWEGVKDKSTFDKPQPLQPQAKSFPPEPTRNEGRFQFVPVKVRVGFFDWIIPGRERRKLFDAEVTDKQQREEVDKRFELAHEEWRRGYDLIKNANLVALANFEEANTAWVLDKNIFYEKQNRFNQEMAELRQQYESHSVEALKRYCAEVLARSEYPESFPKDCTISFDPEAGILVVDYELPTQSSLPDVKSFKYSTARQNFETVHISEAESKRIYDEVLYEICLRTLYELFQSDQTHMIKSIVFNGWVDAIDKATGANTHPCVMTVQVAKTEFMALNLSQVDLKACFRSLKGISGSKLIDFTPVRPVLSLNREDPRFAGSYAVADALSDKTNLAAMDWLDFENLIRELFEKEFSKNGGEVKITQASRDGGVDAIAFDPDPIRGGKIVIQAKRYTNTVGVAAVRDLFGTVHNEGATKGILVTTSDYGPDAYEFIKGKPLTLLSGSELLYLLGIHGYRAKIDLKEAKKLLDEIG